MTVFLFLLLLQRHKTPEKQLEMDHSVSRKVCCDSTASVLYDVDMISDIGFSPFKRCVIILHLRCYKRRGTFAYNVITCLIDIYSKGHRNSIEHAISKQDENIGISPNRETAAGVSTEAWGWLQMQMNNWFVARWGLVLLTWSRVC